MDGGDGHAHVTFFFSGGREAEFEGESRILIPSPKVATYDLQPEIRITSYNVCYTKLLRVFRFYNVVVSAVFEQINHHLNIILFRNKNDLDIFVNLLDLFQNFQPFCVGQAVIKGNYIRKLMQVLV